ncbi:hypothetical protein GCM10010912_66730 [Paenibacillus albidus]|uniref:SGNH/GDSL hydrolase family protein n=1 Tax=Paenibacillus albidus TaxID=2041023 RepID=A0A917D6Y7_9BACL|nr:SGNH/GDSL hydrolase family protein [Paenibacillus albidus]GGG12963.1 hypothetical protein GCM10010912_66730 [Paenibacillus albidus]
MVILLTPTWDRSYGTGDTAWLSLVQHALQIRRLAQEYEVGLSDSFQCFSGYIDNGGELEELLSFVNHPNERGHELIARELTNFFV